MLIRDFTPDDREAVLALADAFYHSPGVLHPIPTAHLARVYAEMCGGGSPRLRGLAVEWEGALAGYCSLAFSYSTEAGGPVVLIEEIFIAPQFRGHGLGTAALRHIRREYAGRAARLRLEVAPENTRAIAMYRREGFETLPYVQMILKDGE